MGVAVFCGIFLLVVAIDEFARNQWPMQRRSALQFLGALPKVRRDK